MVLSESIQALITTAIPDKSRHYDIGVRNGIESITLALSGVVSEDVLTDAVMTALDGFANSL